MLHTAKVSVPLRLHVCLGVCAGVCVRTCVWWRLHGCVVCVCARARVCACVCARMLACVCVGVRVCADRAEADRERGSP